MRRPHVCSLGTNAIAEGQLHSLQSSGDKDIIEKRLKEFASDSQVGKPGILDSPANHLKEMPADLKPMRRIRIGRHRIFYKGHYDQCSFTVFYIKAHKKKGVQDESGQSFQQLLVSVIDYPTTKLLRDESTTIKTPPSTASSPESTKKPRKRKRKVSRGK